MKSLVRLLTLASVCALLGCPQVGPPVAILDDEAVKGAVLKWNRIAIDASGLDHTPPASDEDRQFGSHLGPGRASRAMAIVHIAMFDAVNAVAGGFQSYTRLPQSSLPTLVEVAVAQAAHDTLVSLYPFQVAAFDAELEADLAAAAVGAARENGLALGRAAAEAILAMRDGDGSETEEEYEFSDAPGAWRPDPVNPTQQPLGEEWHNVKPFALNSASQFRAPPPPALDSEEYTQAYDEVLAVGGDGTVTPTTRTEEQTQIGIFWAYDGTPSLCAPPRLYNQIAVEVAADQEVEGVELARLLALVNVAMADAGIAIWESKYHYNFWRPVTGIREADEGTGPTGLGDGNPDTVGDPTYLPLCAPASNLAGPNFTPPFPAYPSGHAGFGGSLFETLRLYFGRDDIAFTIVSDEFNGVTTDNQGNVRPMIPRSFTSFSQAEEENGQSRIYLGIHWSFDKTEGIAQGRRVADHVFGNAFQPLP
ncbi:MAG: phosphatase PAP2 family protein [Planctomycetes bacterium]|nr:phosphatase PAP2 family protein [Planctomycetota bacterium]